MSPYDVCFWLLMTFAGCFFAAGVVRVVQAIRAWRLTARAAREAARLDYLESCTDDDLFVQ